MSTLTAFLWDPAPGRVSNNYHEGGSVLIIAATVEDARAAWDVHFRAKRYNEAVEKWDHEWTASVASEPDRAWPLAGDAQPEVRVFEDSGCC